MQYFAQVPFDKRLEYRNAPGSISRAGRIRCWASMRLPSTTAAWIDDINARMVPGAQANAIIQRLEADNEKQLHPLLSSNCAMPG
jgi:hypothetical protein